MLDSVFFDNMRERYDEVLKLFNDGKNDCSEEKEPYKSKYLAREILLEMKTDINNMFNSTQDAGEKLTTLASLAGVHLLLGVIALEVEEPSNSEAPLMNAMNLLESYAMEPQAIGILINTYNHLGLLWSGRANPETAKEFLTKAEDLYFKFKLSGKEPICISELFQSIFDDEKGYLVFEKLHTITLYYIAQVYGRLKDVLKSAVYCHNTLKRQLFYKDFEPIDFALNAATLSQFFAEQNGFKQALSHLAVASYTLEEYEQKLSAETNKDEVFEAKMEILNHRSADVARCWVKYCLMLLTNSKSRLLCENESCSSTPDLASLTLSEDTKVTKDELSNLHFDDLDLSTYENEVSSNFVLTFEDAKQVFLASQKWLNKAKEYYKLDTLASDHLEIVQDHSSLYSALIFFEEDDERQAKMHKRRIDILENVIQEVNPKYYLKYCKEIWFELGDTYCEILNIKLEKLKNTSERPTPQALSKINNLCEKSTEYFKKLIKSITGNDDGPLPKTIEADSVRLVLHSCIVIARNRMKFITPEKHITLENVQKSYEGYKQVVDYCAADCNNQGVKDFSREQLALCEEMVKILPLKIKEIQAQILAGR